MQPFSAVKITDNVYWVGAIDWHLRDFHGYATERGTTYNAFLILDDKITLIDTVKKPFMDEMMTRIADVVDPAKIDYIVSNHAEMDHSGALLEVLARTGAEKLFASIKGKEALDRHLRIGDRVTVVKDQESISLGKTSLTFYETRMLHWPDSMFCFLDAGGVLFSQDAFGMHLASAERFADEIEPDILEWELAKYFANILMPYAKLVNTRVDKTVALNLPLQMIAPDHGPIYRKDLNWVLDRYKHYAAQKPNPSVVVAFDSMWDSTTAMAQAVADGVCAAGCSVKVFNMKVAHRSNVATALLGAGGLVLGSPTINNQVFPTMADLTSYLKGLRPQNKLGAAFGSYGWGGEAVAQLEEALDAMKIERVAESVRVNYVPTDEELVACRTLGETLARRILGQ